MDRDVRSIGAQVAKGLEPFGVVVHVLSESGSVGVADLYLSTKLPTQSQAVDVGMAGWNSSAHVSVLLYATERVWLREPISLSVDRASAFQIYHALNGEVMKRLRHREARVQRATSRGKFREMLCVQTEHIDAFTRHSFQSSDETGDSERWRCLECQHETVIPRRPSGPAESSTLSLRT